MEYCIVVHPLQSVSRATPAPEIGVCPPRIVRTAVRERLLQMLDGYVDKQLRDPRWIPVVCTSAHTNPTALLQPCEGSRQGLRHACRQERSCSVVWWGFSEIPRATERPVSTDETYALPSHPSFRASHLAEGVCTDAEVSTCFNKAVTSYWR